MHGIYHPDLRVVSLQSSLGEIKKCIQADIKDFFLI